MIDESNIQDQNIDPARSEIDWNLKIKHEPSDYQEYTLPEYIINAPPAKRTGRKR